MKYPCLIPKKYCKTDVKLVLEQEGVTEYGEPLPKYTYEGKCNYQDKAKVIYTAEKKLAQISGTIQLPGDICPELPVITTGIAMVYGVERNITEGRKSRNPDGSVNFTEVFLI